MENIYRILAPTDYSESADHALKIAMSLAERCDSEIHLLHIEDIPPDWVNLVEKSDANLYLTVKKQLERVKTQLSNRGALVMNEDLDVQEFLEYNRSYRAILSHAENYNIDLIVMGAHGLTGIKGLLIGSYTQRVLHHTKIPVLAMKKTDESNDMKKMVFVSDFDPSFVNSFQSVLDFAQRMGVKIDMIFFNTRANFRETHDIKDRMNRYLEMAPDGIIETVDVINSFLFEDGLREYCKTQNIDLVAVTIHSKSHSWGVLGSSVENLINRLEIPILGVPSQV